MELEEKKHHPWKARFFVALTMLVLAFVGLIFSDIRKDGAWSYWRVMAFVFALLCLWLSWYLRRKKRSLSFVKIYHEIFHWISLILAVYLVSVLVRSGIIGRFAASLEVIVLLALTTFIAGIYIEITFIPIGLMLGLFALGAGALAEYLYSILLPVTVVVILGILWLSYRLHHPKKDKN